MTGIIYYLYKIFFHIQFLLRLSLLLLFIAVTYNVNSQTFYTFGTGTSVTDGLSADPVEQYYNYTHFQMVFTAAELSSSGMSSNTEISQIGSQFQKLLAEQEFWQVMQ